MHSIKSKIWDEVDLKLWDVACLAKATHVCFPMEKLLNTIDDDIATATWWAIEASINGQRSTQTTR